MQHTHGSMTFIGCHVESDFSEYKFSVSRSWNDGHWMPVANYVKLLQDNPRQDIVGLSYRVSKSAVPCFWQDGIFNA